MTLQEIVETVSRQTGLEPVTVADQLLAEQGQHAEGPFYPDANNPFNLGPHNRYGSVSEGVAAYVHLINTAPQYAGVRRAAKSDSASFELGAIARSPYEEQHYGAGGTWGPGNKLFDDYPQAVAMVGRFAPDDPNVVAYGKVSKGLETGGIAGAFGAAEGGIMTDTGKKVGNAALDALGFDSTVSRYVLMAFGALLVLLMLYMLLR